MKCSSPFSCSVKNKGFVLVFMAILLPTLLLMGALLVESGNLYVRYTQLQNIAQQSANSGLIVFSEILQEEAENRYNQTCNTEEPPAECDEDPPNIFDFLSASDVQSLVSNAAHQAAVTQGATEFALDFDPQTHIQTENIQVSFPENYSFGASDVDIFVTIQQDVDTLLNVLVPQKTISAKAVAQLPLQ